MSDDPGDDSNKKDLLLRGAGNDPSREWDSLPSTASAFEAYAELLQRGSTQRLAALSAASAASRGGGTLAAPLRSRSAGPAVA